MDTSIILNDKPDPLFLPGPLVNIFTPNDDNMNDKFYPFISPSLTPTQLQVVTFDFKISVYNRWGQLLFESTDYTNAWDGKKDGKIVDEGVYFWRLNYTPRCANEGQIFDLNGTVQVSK